MSVALANTTANLSGKTAVLAEADQTITGLQTFDRGANPPFAVSNALAGKVVNLDADKLDGLDSAAFTKPADLAWTMLNVSIAPGALIDWDPGIVRNTIINISMPSAGNIDIYSFKPAVAPYMGQIVRLLIIAAPPASGLTFLHEHPTGAADYRLRLRASPAQGVNGFWGIADFQYQQFVDGSKAWVIGMLVHGIGGTVPA